LRASIRAWTKCPKKLKNDLLPEAAVEHADKVLGVDDRMRIWRDADSPYGLLYTCQQAQIQWNSDNPIGMLLLLRSCQSLLSAQASQRFDMSTHVSTTPSSCAVRAPTVVMGSLFGRTAWLSAYSQVFLWPHSYITAYAFLVFVLPT